MWKPIDPCSGSKAQCQSNQGICSTNVSCFPQAHIRLGGLLEKLSKQENTMMEKLKRTRRHYRITYK